MIEETKLLAYAYEKFEKGEYSDALEAFVLAYQKGFERELILENIYNCYVNANEKEFRKNFEIHVLGRYEYEKCTLDFIPYKEGEYFIFDKKNKAFLGIFSIERLKSSLPNKIYETNESSDITVVFNWDYREIFDVLVGAENRKIYVIAKNVGNVISFYKIPEFTQFCKNIIVFQGENEYQKYFHKNTQIYLPKLFFTETIDEKESIIKILKKEHEYRITKEGRNTENILLTIGIPTHDRGNLVQERIEQLLTMEYDAEIEIVVSKNGTSLYQEEYEKISKITDKRLAYYGYNRELKPQLNWYNVVEKAHGKFVLLISDEDEVNINAIDHYLYIFKNNKNINVIRSKTSEQYFTIEREYAKAGIEAFKQMFLSQNYLSGLIFKKKDFMKLHLLKLEKYKDNAFYQNYPHEWWCAEMGKIGDCLNEPVLLVIEKESVLEKENEKLNKLGKIKDEQIIDQTFGLPFYATYESRFEQFYGQLEFLQYFMKNNKEEIWIGLYKCIGKLCFLLELARKKGKTKTYCTDTIQRFVEESKKAIQQFDFKDRIIIDGLNEYVDICEEKMIDLNNYEKK